MNQFDYILAIEKMNYDYLMLQNSKQFQIGDGVLRGKKIILSHNLKKANNYLKYRRAEKKIKKISKAGVHDNVWYYTSAPEHINSCVFTCVTGKYDLPNEPILHDNSSFVLFTDEKPQTKSTWIYRDIDVIPQGITGPSINRYCKFHPFDLFQNEKYDFSLYVDGNILVVSDITSLYNVAKSSRIGIAMHKHWARNCAYDEAKVCIYMKKGNSDGITRQMNVYREEGFPPNYGLYEASIIAVDLKNDRAKMVLETWWEEYLRFGSKRDQIAFPYVIWKLGYSMNDIGVLGNNLFYNPKFRNVDFGRHDGMR